MPRYKRLFIGCGSLIGAAVLMITGGILIAPVLVRSLIHPATVSVPQVQIRAPALGERLSVEDPRQVIIQTQGSDDVVLVELWASGRRVASRVLLEGEDRLPDVTRLLWLPETPGVHFLVARARNVEGYTGTSRPVIVEVVPGALQGRVGITIEAPEGATLDQLAQQYGISPEMIRLANPGLIEPLAAAEQITLPLLPEQVPAGYVDDDAATGEAVEEADQPPGPPSEMQGEGQAQPTKDALRVKLPMGFAWTLGVQDLPEAPAELELASVEGCDILLRWSDSASTESGYRVYRYGGGVDHFRPIADLRPNKTLASLTFEDRVPLGGTYHYYVAAVNAAGEAAGPIRRVDVPAESCPAQAPLLGLENLAWLQFQMDRLSTETIYDQLYCYQSLLGRAYNRIPADEDTFLTFGGRNWDIDRYAAGVNRSVFTQPPDETVRVAVECWAWSGASLIDLGSFEANHPREEWDGRDLIGVGATFQLVYRIQPYVNLPAPMFGYYDEIPAPHHLRMLTGEFPPGTSRLEVCRGHFGLPGGNDPGFEAPIGRALCAEHARDAMVWEWDANTYFTRADIDGFRIFVQRDFRDPADLIADRSELQEKGWVSSASQAIFLIGGFDRPRCDQVFGYWVEAFVFDETEGRELRSDLGGPLILSAPSCPTEALVEITLEEIEIDNTDDGWMNPFDCLGCTDHDLDKVYGDGDFIAEAAEGDDVVIASVLFWRDPDWNVFRSRTVDHSDLDLADENLRVCVLHPETPCTDLDSGNNRFQVVLHDGDRLTFDFALWDYDSASGDDVWCGTVEDHEFELGLERHGIGPWRVVGPLTLEEWARLDQSFSFDNPGEYDQDGDCEFFLHIRGIEIRP